jgi:hypothetical protein
MSGGVTRISPGDASQSASLFPASNVIFDGRGAVAERAFGGAAGEEQADGHKQNLADEAEEEAAGHRLEDAGEQAERGVEAEDTEETLKEASQPVGRVGGEEFHRKPES